MGKTRGATKVKAPVNEKTAIEKTPTSCRQCERWKDAREIASEVGVMEVVGTAIEKIEAVLKAEGFKPTIGDYMKLVQMEKELNALNEDTKEIRVTWVKPPESETEG